ncbi:hypothetical protein GX586_08425 [bacterium]|nr:hypothetical protein [bacterium]
MRRGSLSAAAACILLQTLGGCEEPSRPPAAGLPIRAAAPQPVPAVSSPAPERAQAQPAATALTALERFRALADNRLAVRASLGVRAARALSSNAIEVVIGLSVNPGACANPAAYRIASHDDERYACERFVRPLAATARTEREVDAVAGCGHETFKRTIVVLTSPFPMRAGCTYYVVAQGDKGQMVTGARTAQGFAFDGGAGSNDAAGEVDAAVLGLRCIEPAGPGIIRVEFGPNVSIAAATNAASYAVSVNGTSVAVRATGRISKVDTYIPVGWPMAAIAMHEIFLSLGQPFDDGDTTDLSVTEAVTHGPTNASIVFAQGRSLCNSVKVNQTGYLPDGPKVGYLGRWMGSMPALRYEAPPVFAVCDEATGLPVFTGAAVLVHSAGVRNEGRHKDDYSGENVYALDFSAMAVTGRFFIAVPRTGRSPGFTIAADAYRGAFLTQATAVFQQRCGIALEPPHSAWRRIACHTNGVVPTVQVKHEPHEWKVLARRVDTAWVKAHGGPIRTRGGHHDAGDYNPRSHIDVAQSLMDAYEIAPAAFTDGQLNIPENTNGVPDILDEAAWALRLWIDLQDSDGGVFNGTESNGDPNFIQTVELDVLGDYAYAKDAAGSFTFAGAMAQTARILAGLGRKERAAAFLGKAVRAYEWGCAHPPADAADRLRHFDSPRAYAASELLLTTGDPRYNTAFIESCAWRSDRSAQLDEYRRYDQRRAAWAYARCASNTADAAVQHAVRAAIISRADAWIAYARTMGYAFIKHPDAPINWGTGGQPKWLDEVVWAYALTRRPVYREWMIRTCDYTLGANPLNRGFIAGLGTRTVRAPLHNSRYSTFGEVVDGMQVQGPHHEGDGYRVRETAYPPIRKDAAQLQSFVDCHFAIAMDEGTVDAMAKAMAVFGILLPGAQDAADGTARPR